MGVQEGERVWPDSPPARTIAGNDVRMVRTHRLHSVDSFDPHLCPYFRVALSPRRRRLVMTGSIVGPTTGAVRHKALLHVDISISGLRVSHISHRTATPVRRHGASEVAYLELRA